MNYEPIIGLEVHAQLLTDSKIFCRCKTKFGGEPNSQVCPVCLGLPGVLPVLNKRAVEFAVRLGLATNCHIAPHSIFARKNYFYPDLPKGYQISQFEEPLCAEGYVEFEVDGKIKRVGLIRIHLEEDAGKSVHAEEYVEENETLVDLNRCGVPLIEIVSKPDIRSPKEAALYLAQLRQIVQYLEICDGNMEQGSLRCDANISVRPAGSSKFGVKTELKNMNTIRGVEKAMELEVSRQIETLEAGRVVAQETLLWDANKNEIVSMRSKEYSHDYRYFPEPDLVPLQVESDWIDEIRRGLPELPLARKQRFIKQYGIPEHDVQVLIDNRDLADYFEQVAQNTGDAKTSSNWVRGEVLRILKEQQIDIKASAVSAANLAELIKLINNGTISGKIAKSVFEEMRKTGKSPDAIVEQKGLKQITDSGEIESQVKQVLADNPEEVKKYLSGKEQVLGFLVGQVMKATRGKANPKLVNEMLRKELAKLP
ncbi:Asp-tRNA(Asn)/Glu-tRNA(Gln) amidotransferase subunit GatB [candidate division KSB1 bacterium]|nr:Asp-tRNA(Asn)/Glu-tRNA(Gln) amidotransferase subunit GatB [candidate division KSB1 bacterium]NIR70140.1 Asp-tRNA(Asn)/Glu-tRNA(Gln) amidotransferase subunit GatB [candidate division KSB1 bacterium]NIS28052.1 Asp-tRNA(Asn)/Glu-tRNA(Gln) amidotransferase subunit GatB [candidate division KSB1 bacterium]NIT74921.1 Asp-tRNA(Asn)/Glu-tRNA(Gln) amidotransferase subunit GatB [candidate division KSB1 bacterium]NIU28705.1 Asp-tRNA(Asn)/Glu-tRNA(Gln) amidotransferase subunit GatB [candidate division KS